MFKSRPSRLIMIPRPSRAREPPRTRSSAEMVAVVVARWEDASGGEGEIAGVGMGLVVEGEAVVGVGAALGLGNREGEGEEGEEEGCD